MSYWCWDRWWRAANVLYALCTTVASYQTAYNHTMRTGISHRCFANRALLTEEHAPPALPIKCRVCLQIFDSLVDYNAHARGYFPYIRVRNLIQRPHGPAGTTHHGDFLHRPASAPVRNRIGGALGKEPRHQEGQYQQGAAGERSQHQRWADSSIPHGDRREKERH